MSTELERIATLEERYASLAKEVGNLRRERDNAFKTGLCLLGAALLAVVGYIIELWHR